MAAEGKAQFAQITVYLCHSQQRAVSIDGLQAGKFVFVVLIVNDEAEVIVDRGCR